MAAANKVLSGMYEESPVCFSAGRQYACIRGKGSLDINSTNCTSYELLDADSKTSATSAVCRAALGAAILGPAGLLAGITAKKKKSYLIKIEWKTGGSSIIEVDDDYYKKIVCAFV